MAWEWTEALRKHDALWKECKDDLAALADAELRKLPRTEPAGAERQLGLAMGIERVLALVTRKEREEDARAKQPQQRPAGTGRPTTLPPGRPVLTVVGFDRG